MNYWQNSKTKHINNQLHKTIQKNQQKTPVFLKNLTSKTTFQTVYIFLHSFIMKTSNNQQQKLQKKKKKLILNKCEILFLIQTIKRLNKRTPNKVPSKTFYLKTHL